MIFKLIIIIKYYDILCLIYYTCHRKHKTVQNFKTLVDQKVSEKSNIKLHVHVQNYNMKIYVLWHKILLLA